MAEQRAELAELAEPTAELAELAEPTAEHGNMVTDLSPNTGSHGRYRFIIAGACEYFCSVTKHVRYTDLYLTFEHITLVTLLGNKYNLHLVSFDTNVILLVDNSIQNPRQIKDNIGIKRHEVEILYITIVFK